ncbi:alpha/beta fold hydrolase [Lolliginicoccus levis]|uniref:alpha/beta fold hydrolase n=1 Tax=Lolliginicoccus levis TaxID=2919542 RepID=UPI0024200BD8|nr:alpha/beta hydrolase [Lolliginicoccus levis]
MTTEVPTRSGFAEAGDLRLGFEEHGPADGIPILLIMGFGAQLTLWPQQLCTTLAMKGFRVIRFDNRDIGLSTKLDGTRVEGRFLARILRSQLGKPSDVPYTLVDMAEDTRQLLDSLGIERAHIVGASMGGMITQVLAAQYPERVHSATIIFSSTNEPFLPPPTPTALRALLAPPPRNPTTEALVERSVRTFRVLSGPGYPRSTEELRELALEQVQRSHYPAGMVRQFAAVLGTGSLREYARAITAPATVIHGSADPLVRPRSGRAVARAIPGASLTVIDGMGHDLPPALVPRIAGEILAATARAS